MRLRPAGGLPALPLTLAAIVVTLAASSSVAADGIFSFDYRRIDLDNGFRAYLIDAGAPNQIAYVTLVRTGAREEVEPGRTGFAHFFELAKLVAEGLPADQVERAREYLHNFSVTYGSTVGRRLAFAIDDEFYGLEKPGYLASIRPGLAEVTADSVRQAIARHLQTENMYVVFITQDAQALKRKLLSGEPTAITYPGEQPEVLLAEDQEIASFPIPLEEDDFEIVDILEVFEGSPPSE